MLSTLPRPAEDDEAARAREAYAALRAEDAAKGGLPLAQRRELLRALAAKLVERRAAFVAALDADFGRRSAEETLLAEILGVATAARHARRHLRRWARPRQVGAPFPFWPSRAWLVPQPLGVVGIIAPWNYPVQLALSPLVGALAAGNRALVKASELTPQASAEIACLIEDAIGPKVARTVPGGPAAAAAVAALPLDHLLFTGSTVRGREVMRAAAGNLTPLTLELGGKCPAIVLPDVDLDAAARAIVTGKALNAGQTCVAPDPVLLVGVPVEAMRAALARAYRACYPDGPGTAVISPAHRERIERLAEGATLEPLGAPGLLLAPSPPEGSKLLEEEVFGPILPLLPMADLAAALTWVRARPAPLAVYLFTKDARAEAQALAATRAGALVVGATVVQAAMETLPFGGVGASGFGRYHGRAGFDSFSNLRVHVRAARFGLWRLVEPPFGPKKRRLIERLLGA
jgi:acyl-CoA reductase-like NAD-dependent aldehyde dehydrogenase